MQERGVSINSQKQGRVLKPTKERKTQHASSELSLSLSLSLSLFFGSSVFTCSHPASSHTSPYLKSLQICEADLSETIA